jgi:hypothetical protein
MTAWRNRRDGKIQMTWIIKLTHIFRAETSEVLESSVQTRNADGKNAEWGAAVAETARHRIASVR